MYVLYQRLLASKWHLDPSTTTATTINNDHGQISVLATLRDGFMRNKEDQLKEYRSKSLSLHIQPWSHYECAKLFRFSGRQPSF
jgi:hypothetical protein